MKVGAWMLALVIGLAMAFAGCGGDDGGGAATTAAEAPSRGFSKSDRETGVVEFFKDDKGYGFIKPHSGGKDVFVHHSQIEREGFKSLKRGDEVSYIRVDDAKGPRAESVQLLNGE